jgi:hypothetical protein
MMRTTRRRARKAHRCPTCRSTIPIGATYLEHVASPNHEDLGHQYWWRLPECAACAEMCGRGHLLAGAA